MDNFFKLMLVLIWLIAIIFLIHSMLKGAF